MAVYLYFGLPGCGKTSLATLLAIETSNNIKMGFSPYKSVVINTPVKYENVLYCEDLSWFGKYMYTDYLLIIDEATLEFDNRDWKLFTKNNKQGFILHRHMRTDIHIFVQKFNGVDSKVRNLTDKLYMMKKGAIFKQLSYIYRVPYGIDFSKQEGAKYGDIIEGYCRPDFFSRLFCKRLYRPVVYPYFDSFWLPDLPPMPDGILKDLTKETYIPSQINDFTPTVGADQSDTNPFDQINLDDFIEKEEL